MFFHLPSNIIHEIYTFDSTFHEKRKENDHELWKKSFYLFFRIFLRHIFFQSKPILKRKLEFFFYYLLNHYEKSTYGAWFTFAFHEPNGENSMFIKPNPSDITMNVSWKNNTLQYSNYVLLHDLENDYDDFDDIEHPLFARIIIPYHHKIHFHERHTLETIRFLRE